MSTETTERLVEVECCITVETQAAVRVIQPGVDAKWIARSLCTHLSTRPRKRRWGDSKRLKEATITMPEWVAKQKGLNY